MSNSYSYETTVRAPAILYELVLADGTLLTEELFLDNVERIEFSKSNKLGCISCSSKNIVTLPLFPVNNMTFKGVTNSRLAVEFRVGEESTTDPEVVYRYLRRCKLAVIEGFTDLTPFHLNDSPKAEQEKSA